MPKRARSDVWDHMQKIKPDMVRCNICAKEFTYSGSTSTLTRHLQTIHGNIFEPSSSSEAPKVDPAAARKQTCLNFGRKFTDVRQEKANELLTKFIISNMLPLSLVDDAAFREFIAFLEPDYRIPCRQTFCGRLDGMKVERAKTVQSEMASASSVAVTTDIWTSVANEPYISLTASYITPDWKLVSRSLSNEAIEERHTQVQHSNVITYEKQGRF